MNRLAPSDLLMKNCSKFQSEISDHSDNFLSVSWHISLELTAGHPNKCTNIIPLQIAAKNLVCPGFPVESEERCVSVWLLNVDGCERSRQKKEARGGWVRRQAQFGVVVVEIIY